MKVALCTMGQVCLTRKGTEGNLTDPQSTAFQLGFNLIESNLTSALVNSETLTNLHELADADLREPN